MLKFVLGFDQKLPRQKSAGFLSLLPKHFATAIIALYAPNQLKNVVPNTCLMLKNDWPYCVVRPTEPGLSLVEEVKMFCQLHILQELPDEICAHELPVFDGGLPKILPIILEKYLANGYYGQIDIIQKWTGKPSRRLQSARFLIGFREVSGERRFEIELSVDETNDALFAATKDLRQQALDFGCRQVSESHVGESSLLVGVKN